MCVSMVLLPSKIEVGSFQVLRKLCQAASPENHSDDRKLNKESGRERMSRKQGVRNKNNIKKYQQKQVEEKPEYVGLKPIKEDNLKASRAVTKQTLQLKMAVLQFHIHLLAH